ncbi:hypothetical protein R3W88_029801 [Solanum pinnatisectum]|uniref:Protein TIC 214 n=1 Tax=Solanum pinnatisectum TaxID=50273 RepID=A0AAV9K6T3_9SOLN|nr:hypothetical protein R3W88_029801 [Solanum pinnatisectum]
MGKKNQECDEISIRQAIIRGIDRPNRFDYCFNLFFTCKKQSNKRNIFYSNHSQSLLRPQPLPRPQFDFGLEHYMSIKRSSTSTVPLKRSETEPSKRIKKFRFNNESDFQSKYPFLTEIGMFSI